MLQLCSCKSFVWLCVYNFVFGCQWSAVCKCRFWSAIWISPCSTLQVLAATGNICTIVNSRKHFRTMDVYIMFYNAIVMIGKMYRSSELYWVCENIFNREIKCTVARAVISISWYWCILISLLCIISLLARITQYEVSPDIEDVKWKHTAVNGLLLSITDIQQENTFPNSSRSKNYTVVVHGYVVSINGIHQYLKKF